MDISAFKNIKEKRVDISEYFGKDDFITVKYINREIWNYINKMTVKTEDGLLYQEMQKLPDTADKWNIAIKNITAKELEKAKECSVIVNKLLIEHGIDDKNHSFTDNDKPIKLNYEILNLIGGKQNESGLDFYNFILNEVRLFNSGYDLGELKGKN
jgi:lysyl-tRNA synthetase class II